jgi:hypothetical protein
MEEISAPTQIIHSRNWKKPVIIIAIIVIPLIFAIPFILQLFAKSEEKGFFLNDLTLHELKDSEQAVTLGWEMSYVNEYDGELALTAYQIRIETKIQSSNKWQELMVLSGEQSVIIPENGHSNFSIKFDLSNGESDSALKEFLGKILMKEEITFRLTGGFKASPLSNVNIPDVFEIDILKKATELFGYSIPTHGPTFLTIKDFQTHTPDPAYPSLFKMSVLSEYKNPFNFPINFISAKATILNRTLDGTMGTINWGLAELGEIIKNGTKNIEQILYVPTNQIKWIVEDLLSNRTDVVKIIDLEGTVKIGEVIISFQRDLESAHSDLQFKLTIVGYRADINGNLILDAAIDNPCNIIFNITYIDIDMFVAGTTQKVLEVSQSLDITILPYSQTMITNIVASAKYETFLLHLNDKFDLIGNLQANCYNFNGVIYFDSKNVELLTS